MLYGDKVKNKSNYIKKEKSKKVKKTIGNKGKLVTVAAVSIVNMFTFCNYGQLGGDAALNSIGEKHDVYQAAVDVSTDLGYASKTLGQGFYNYDDRDLNLLYDKDMTENEIMALSVAADNLNFIISACNDSMKINVLPYTFENSIKLRNTVTVRRGAEFMFDSYTAAFYVPVLNEIVFEQKFALPHVFIHEILHHLGFYDDYLRPKEERYYDTIMGRGNLSLNDVKMIYAKVHDKKLSEKQLESLHEAYRKYSISNDLYNASHYAKVETIEQVAVDEIETSLSNDLSQSVNLIPFDDNQIYYICRMNLEDTGMVIKGRYGMRVFNNDSISVSGSWNSISADKKIKAWRYGDSLSFMVRDSDNVYTGYYLKGKGVSNLNTYKIVSEEYFDSFVALDSPQKLFDDYVVKKKQMQGDITALQSTLDELDEFAKELYNSAEECDEKLPSSTTGHYGSGMEYAIIDKKEIDLEPEEKPSR